MRFFHIKLCGEAELIMEEKARLKLQDRVSKSLRLQPSTSRPAENYALLGLQHPGK